MRYPCRVCRMARCRPGKECPTWGEWFQSEWDGMRKKKAARVVGREQPEKDKPISHREYVFTHILTAGWRDVK